MNDQAICANCGSPMTEDDAFCGKCGARTSPPEPAVEATEEETPKGACPNCRKTLTETGRYCHECGAELGDAGGRFEPASEEETKAYCPRCGQAAPLREYLEHCPRCGQRIHLVLEINDLVLYMQEVRTFAELRLRSVHDKPIRLCEFRVFLEGQELSARRFRVGPGFEIAPELSEVRADRFVYPRKPNPVQGIEGCPFGDASIEVILEYETDGKRYRAGGLHDIEVLEREASPQTIMAKVENIIHQTGDGPKSAGAWDQDVNIDFRGVDGPQRAADFINWLKEKRGLQFRPILMRFDSVTEVEVEPTLPAPPSCAPSDRARLWFVDNGILRNYCLLTGREVKLGRDPRQVDVRLYEIERCRANLECQASQGVPANQRGSGSQVSRLHWQAEPTPNGVRITQLTGSSVGTVSGGKTLQAGDAALLGRNETIAIPDVIGLKYAANAPAFGGADAARALARQVLETMPSPPPAAEPWTGQYGGYRLDRLFSLTGERVGDYEDPKTAESYVLIPGWATLGSSSDACITVPGPDVAPLHAALLHIDGYFFLYPIAAEVVTLLNGKQACAGIPWPLSPPATIQLGPTSLTFEGFSQMFV